MSSGEGDLSMSANGRKEADTCIGGCRKRSVIEGGNRGI